MKTLINGKFKLNLPDFRAKQFKGDWEKERLDSMHKNIKAGNVIIDVGAENGDMSALFALWSGNNNTIGLIEASPFYWPVIKQIWEKNEIKYRPYYFVGFASRVDEYKPKRMDVNSGDLNGWPMCAYGEIIPEYGFRHLYQQTDSTPQIKIDTFCKLNNLVPDIINMDIEGSEYEALLGAENVLRNNSPLVYVSVHVNFMRDMYQYDSSILHSYMKDFGYKSLLLAVDHEEHWVFYKNEIIK